MSSDRQRDNGRVDQRREVADLCLEDVLHAHTDVSRQSRSREPEGSSGLCKGLEREVDEVGMEVLV